MWDVGECPEGADGNLPAPLDGSEGEEGIALVLFGPFVLFGFFGPLAGMELT